MKTRKIKMLGTHMGSTDGITSKEYLEGQTYDLPPRLSQIFLDAEWAEEITALDGPEEIKAEVVEEVTEESPATKKAAAKKKAAARKRAARKKAAEKTK